MLANRSMPRSSVIPEFPYRDVTEAVGWLCETFGLTVRIRMGNHRAQLNFGDGSMVVIERRAGDDSRCSVMVRVEDAYGHHERAVKHGATILRPPADYPYGERQYTAEDLGGHRWTFSQSIADVAPEKWGGTTR
jgi:uncharacterized glyoxalase superfamily protein PhnB